MTIPKAETVTTVEQARDLAIQWQHWQSGQSLSWGESSDWYCFFEALGVRFGLTQEFKDNGVI